MRAENKNQRWRLLEDILAQYPNGVSIRELATRLNVDRGTIYRDIQQLSEAGLPIWHESGMVGLLIEQSLPPLRLTLYEALSLFIAARLLSKQSREYDPHVISVLNKLARVIPEPVSLHIRQSLEIIQQQPHNDLYVSHLETLMRAWVHQQRILIGYQSAGKHVVKERLFDVYFIEPLESVFSCYVIGFDHFYKQVRTFKIKRIQYIVLGSSIERVSYERRNESG